MAISKERLEKIAGNIGNARILILGDIMLDEYLYGSVSRISPEAPVPVVEINEEQLRLGGAANVANNVAALGDTPLLLGTVGEDDASIKLSQLLKSRGIGRDFLVNDKKRRTTIKTRIIAHSQQVVRADREDAVEISDDVERVVFERFKSAVDDIKAGIISDYGKGLITESLLEKSSLSVAKRGFLSGSIPKKVISSITGRFQSSPPITTKPVLSPEDGSEPTMISRRSANSFSKSLNPNRS